MARGWDSKSVESQREAFDSEKRSSSRPQLTVEQIERQRQKEALRLSRTRILHELEETRVPRRRKILEASLAYLDAKLANLG